MRNAPRGVYQLRDLGLDDFLGFFLILGIQIIKPKCQDVQPVSDVIMHGDGDSFPLVFLPFDVFYGEFQLMIQLCLELDIFFLQDPADKTAIRYQNKRDDDNQNENQQYKVGDIEVYFFNLIKVYKIVKYKPTSSILLILHIT